MKIKYLDPEWDEAMAANERQEYYWCKMLNGGTCVKCYKPSLAQIVLNRGLYKDMTPIVSKRPEAKRPRRRFNRDFKRRSSSWYQPYNLFERSLEGLS